MEYSNNDRVWLLTVDKNGDIKLVSYPKRRKKDVKKKR